MTSTDGNGSNPPPDDPRGSDSSRFRRPALGVAMGGLFCLEACTYFMDRPPLDADAVATLALMVQIGLVLTAFISRAILNNIDSSVAYLALACLHVAMLSHLSALHVSPVLSLLVIVVVSGALRMRGGGDPFREWVAATWLRVLAITAIVLGVIILLDPVKSVYGIIVGAGMCMAGVAHLRIPNHSPQTAEGE